MLDIPEVLPLPDALIERFEDDLIDSIALKIQGLLIQQKNQHIHPNIKPVNVRIDREDIEIAKRLGGGNVSAGLRVALKLVAASLKIHSPNLGIPLGSGFMGESINSLEKAHAGSVP